jgi:hypothetical protein
LGHFLEKQFVDQAHDLFLHRAGWFGAQIIQAGMKKTFSESPEN